MDGPQGACEPSEVICRMFSCCGWGGAELPSGLFYGNIAFYGNHGSQDTFRSVLFLTVLRASVQIAVGCNIGFS